MHTSKAASSRDILVCFRAVLVLRPLITVLVFAHSGHTSADPDGTPASRCLATLSYTLV